MATYYKLLLELSILRFAIRYGIFYEFNHFKAAAYHLVRLVMCLTNLFISDQNHLSTCFIYFSNTTHPSASSEKLASHIK